ncbi:MAG: hypothetical protein ACI8RD_001216 [Bacillariaceae sp.]|jgi:hypothetical protein
MSSRNPRRDSQFSGAAALFRKKEMDVRIDGNNNASFTSPIRKKVGLAKNNGNGKDNTSLNPPSFVSPGRRISSNDPRTSWKNSGTFSPPSFATSSMSKYATSSYLNKQYGTPSPEKSKSKAASSYSPNRFGGAIPFSNLDTEPDIKIQVKSNIQEKIKARQRSNYMKPHSSSSSSSSPSGGNNSNIPEHIRKVQEREERLRRAEEEKEYQAKAKEERRRRAEEEKEYRSASLVQAAFLGWYARVQYQKLHQLDAQKRKREAAILTIQNTFRMYIQRKRYIRIIECKRRRERNVKEMKKINKTIEKMPKKIKSDIKEMKQEYALKKKELKRTCRKQIKEDDEQLQRVKKSGQDMVKYLQAENEKTRILQQTLQRKQDVLEKQFELLTAKSEEISTNFLSLKQWVDTKNVAIQKHEAADHKCRHRYLPKYRKDLAQRNMYCITEFRIKECYKKQLKKILKEIEKKSKDPSLVKLVKKDMKSCQKTLKEIPDNPIPEALEDRLKRRS